MRRLVVACIIFGILTMGSIGLVSAGEAPEADEVIVVDFSTHDVDEELLEAFYGHLESIIASEDVMSIGETGDVTMDELLLMAGCGSTSPECLSMLGDFVDGDHLLFGSIERSDDVHMFTMTLFDFESGEFVRELTDKTLRGDQAWLDEGMPAVIEHLLYGETATVEVEVAGYDAADVQLNGEAVGTGTLTVDDVAPGEIVAVVTGPDGQEQQERFIVRHDDVHTVEFDFAPAIAEIDDPGDAPSIVPGLAVGGVGVAGLIVGVVGQTQLSSAEAEANTLVGDNSDAIQEDQLARAQQLDSDMTRGNTMRWLGFGTGVAGLAGGGFLLFQALTSDSPAGGEVADSGPSFELDVSDEGFSAGFRLQY